MNRTTNTHSMHRSSGVGALLAIAGLAVVTGFAQAQTAGDGAESFDLGESGNGGAQAPGDPFDHMKDTITLTGVVRDFRAGDQSNPHVDFQRQPRGDSGSGQFGLYMNMVADELDDDGKPVRRSGGHRVTSKWTDSEGRPIMAPRDYIASRDGDSTGSMQDEGSATDSAESFSQWFRDIPSVNISRPLDITMTRVEGTNKYVFDDKQDDYYNARGGFFPVNNDLYGNFTADKNFHFTYELATGFTYEADAGQVFRFIGDDDVWVYIDGKLVIDLGGVHSAEEQTIDLDRLTWLEDGHNYTLHFFFAERHTTQSNFRIETTLSLKSIDLPTTAALFD